MSKFLKILMSPCYIPTLTCFRAFRSHPGGKLCPEFTPIKGHIGTLFQTQASIP